MLATAPLWLIFLLSIALFGVASEIGHRIGVESEREANVVTLQASVLGLLALMMSFTFAMSVAHFDQRREATLGEANAIGTAALRARLLPPPLGAESLDLLQNYVAIRTELAHSLVTPASRDAAIARSNELHEGLWRVVQEAVRKDSAMVPTGFFIQALNELVDSHERRLTAFRRRVPPTVFIALYGIATLGIGFSGYASGLDRKRWRLPVYLVNILVASVTLLIQDIDRPDVGSVQVSTQPLIDAAESLSSYSRAGGSTPEPAQQTAPAR